MASTEPTKTLNVIPFPTFSEFERALKREIPSAQLLWMAIAKLSTEGRYTSKTPAEIYEIIRKTAEETYTTP